MQITVLVTYATRYGSTEEVAQTVAESLRETAATVDVLPVRHVRSPEQYDAIVLGAPLYMGHLHKDALRFLNQHRRALTKVPVALFFLGPVRNDEKDWSSARSQLAHEMARFPWLEPVARQIFGGKLDPARFGFPLRLIPPLRKMKPADIRDWSAIHSWATGLAPALQPCTSNFPNVQHIR
ncbi:MAG TPA: flavodoxin domain-containing protein [Acidobacteriaceae bacterium]|jgi:menaquinone-dependent protoporphyrinogen oxidase